MPKEVGREEKLLFGNGKKINILVEQEKWREPLSFEMSNMLRSY